MPFPFDKYPWLNFQELNLAYFIKHFREIFQQWDTLLNEMYEWKDATDAELAEWKSTVETGISSWETGLQQSMEVWKDETEADISAWKAATLSALDAWKSATTVVFEQIRTEAAASAQAAAGSAASAQTALAGAQAAQAAAEAAATGIQSELAQIQTNTADIAELTTQIQNDFQIPVGLETTTTPGYFIDATNNNLTESANFSVINPIPVKQGQVITLHSKGYRKSVGMIATCDADGTNISTVVASVDSTVRDYVYTVENDGYIMGSVLNTEPYTLKIDLDYYKFVEPLESNLVFAGNEAVNLQIAVNKSFVSADTNAVNTNADFCIFNTIKLYKGQTVNFTAQGYGTVVGMINKYDPYLDKYVCLVPSIDSTERLYTYTATETIYIRLCANKIVAYSCYITTPVSRFVNNDSVSEILDEKNEGIENIEITNALTGYFVDATQNRVDAASNYNITNSVFLYKGQTIIVNAKGYNTSVGMINIYEPENNSYRTVVASIDSDVHDYIWTATKNCYVRASYNKTETITIRRFTEKDFSAVITNIQNELADIANTTIKNRVEYPQLFDNFVCIGDSLTAGYDGSGDTPLVKNYPHFLEKRTFAETEIKAHGGWTAKQVWDGIISSATDLANYDCAIIYLGTNGGLTDTVNTDCNIDYTLNADTNTGCYGKIIGKIKADAPNCKIFCIAGPSEGTALTRETTMNAAVRNLTAFYSVGLIDLKDSILTDNGTNGSVERHLYRPFDGVHYNALGYLTLANLICDNMLIYMQNHLDSYND